MSLFAQTIVSTSPENKNVVLEEFTGINCSACPSGHTASQNIQNANPNDVFIINIHTGVYASPSGSQPDFRTDFGAAIAGQSGLAFYPSGTINRHVFSGGVTAMGAGSWAVPASQVLAEDSYVNVAIETEIDRASRVATIHVEAYYTGDSPEETNLLNVVILQNNTIAYQNGGSSSYNHMHRLIDMPAGQWGLEIPVTTTGTFVDEAIEFTIPVNNRGVPIILDDLQFVAFVAETHQEIISGNGCDPTFVGTAPNDDISLDEIIVDDMVCAGDFTASIVLSNFGTTNINSMAINYQVNDETVETYNWSGTLNSLDTVEIELPEVTFIPQGTNTFEVTIESDDNNDNNSLYTEIEDALGGITWVKLHIETDDNGDDFRWSLRTSNGDIIDYSNDCEDNTIYNLWYELSPDCYKLNLSDDGGNGGTIVTISDIYSELYSVSGDWGDELFARFTTESAPAQLTSIPTQDSVGASISTTVKIKFDQPVRYIDNSPIPQTNSGLPISFTDGYKADIPFTININSSRTRFTIVPDSDLEEGREYTLTLEGEIIENYYNNEIVDDFTFSFTTTDEVNVEEVNNNINIYPNPATDIINITNAENSTIEIYNIAGELVISTTETNIDVSTLTNGTYLIKVIAEDNIITEIINISH